MQPSPNIIYCLIDPRDGTCFYVGQSSVGEGEPLNYIKRARTLRTNRNVTRYLRRLHDIGLKATWEILEEIDDVSKLDDAEIFWIASFRAAGATIMNMMDGGLGRRGYKHSPKTIEKMKATKASPLGKQRMKNAMEKAWAQPESRASWLKNRNSNEAKEKHAAAIKTVVSTPEHKLKMRESLNSEKTRKKRAETLAKPEVRARRSEIFKEISNRPDVKAKNIASNKAKAKQKKELADGKE